MKDILIFLSLHNSPGNINFIIGSAKKNSPKVHGIAITADSFIDIFILLSMFFFSF